MSLTAILWVVLAVVTFAGVIIRPSWSVALYMLTFFGAPHLWWWGKDLPELRYALIAGVIMMVAVGLHSAAKTGRPEGLRLPSLAALGMVVNATFVNFFIASRPDVSMEGYVELLKFVALYFLLAGSIRDRKDMRLILVAMALGAAYIGYEVTINERGDFNAGRLEGVGAPGADTANALASMLLLVLPLIGSLFIDGKLWQKALVVIAAPLALNVVILCNSRGAFLGLIGGAAVFLFLARGETRKKAARVLVLGGVALYMLLGDPEILDRFTTTFVGAEERDRSAANRIEFWTAGVLMLRDYPLGDGGGAFKYVHAKEFLEEAGSKQQARSLHNGYLTEATDWGVQGLVLKLVFSFGAMLMAYRTLERCRSAGRLDDALVGISFIVAFSGFLIICMFGSYLSSEWAYWIVAYLVRYSEVYAVPDEEVVGVRAASPGRSLVTA
jgi:putative inorganic carbon (hco3(-)) transporter